ncbi:hypothetical protein Daus18300_004817 [Diaporthe australafricana]|uniref:Uncharacterized protein n=1 Tax=Diaporthe australafricana TaxID=127596 RepID=A0ABR3X5W7_9PEZI
MLFNKFCILALAAVAVASPSGLMPRMDDPKVSPEDYSWDKAEANAINDDEFSLFVDPAHPGLVCFVLAMKGKMQKAKKAFVPGKENDKGTETAIRQYINSGKINEASKKWDASRTLRYQLMCKADCPELLIPEAVLPQKGGVGTNELGIFAQCFKSTADLKKGMEEMGFSMVTLDYQKGWGVEGPPN